MKDFLYSELSVEGNETHTRLLPPLLLSPPPCPQLTFGGPPLEGLINLPKHLLTSPLKSQMRAALFP